MAFTATQATDRAYSLGPHKEEVWNFSVVSGDTSGTLTSARLSNIDHVIVCCGGLVLTSQPTRSGKTVTLAFTDPAANRFGQIIIRGR